MSHPGYMHILKCYTSNTQQDGMKASGQREIVYNDPLRGKTASK